MSSGIHRQTEIRDDQILTIRPIARFARRGDNEWAVAVGAKQRVLLGHTVESVLPELASVLDGRRDVASAAAQLSALCALSVSVARASLDRLYQWEILDDVAGYRSDAVGPQRRSHAAQERFFSLFSSRPVRNQRSLAGSRVAIVSTRADADWLRSLLEASGLSITPGSEVGVDAADLVVAWGVPLLGVELEGLNRRCVARGVPLLPVTLDVASGCLGPLVLAGESACIACVTDPFCCGTGVDRGDAHAAPASSRVARVIAHLTALEVLRFLAPCLRPSTVGVREHYDGSTHRLTTVEVLRRPRCPRCGDLVKRSPAIAFQRQGVVSAGR